jgi:RNA 2',3'-cyclic 3'-phosphodiesterase
VTPAQDVPTLGPVGRLFLGVAIPEPIRASLERHLRGALGERPLPGRPVPPHNWHLTVRFLGDTPAPHWEALRRELDGADLGTRFALRFGGPGAFPRPARASVLWLGIEEGVEPLTRLVAAAEGAARRAGFEPEERPFRAHLTLSRIQPPRDVRELLASIPPAAEGMEVTGLVLFRSHLGAGPPRYEVWERFTLADPRG